MTYETDKQAEKDDEASEPSAESIESRRAGSGSPPRAGDYTDWDGLSGPILCRAAGPSQGIGLLRCQHPKRTFQQLWEIVRV